MKESSGSNASLIRRAKGGGDVFLQRIMMMMGTKERSKIEKLIESRKLKFEILQYVPKFLIELFEGRYRFTRVK